MRAGHSLIAPIILSVAIAGCAAQAESPTAKDVRAIVAEHLGIKPELVTDKARFVADLGADSLDQVELIMAMEEKFNISIADADAEKVVSVGDAIRTVERLRK